MLTLSFADWFYIFFPCQAAPIEEEYRHVLSHLAPHTEYQIRLYCTNHWGRSDLSRTLRATTRPCKS